MPGLHPVNRTYMPVSQATASIFSSCKKLIEPLFSHSLREIDFHSLQLWSFH
jgi:hypothetical protein